MKQVLATKDKAEVRQTKTQLAKKLGVSRGILYYRHKKPLKDENMRDEIRKVLDNHPAYGHRRIALEMGLNRKRIRRDNEEVSLDAAKKTQAVC